MRFHIMQKKDVNYALAHGDDSRTQHGANTPTKQFNCPIYNRMRSYPPDAQRPVQDASDVLNQISTFEHHSRLLPPPPHTSRSNSLQIMAELSSDSSDSNHCDSPQSRSSDFSTDLCSNFFMSAPPSGDTPQIPQGADPSCMDLRMGMVTAMHRPTMTRVVSSDLAFPTETVFVTDAGLSRLKMAPETSGETDNAPPRLAVGSTPIRVDARTIFPSYE